MKLNAAVPPRFIFTWLLFPTPGRLDKRLPGPIAVSLSRYTGCLMIGDTQSESCIPPLEKKKYREQFISQLQPHENTLSEFDGQRRMLLSCRDCRKVSLFCLFKEEPVYSGNATTGRWDNRGAANPFFVWRWR